VHPLDILSLSLGILGAIPVLGTANSVTMRYIRVRRLLRLQSKSRLDVVITTSSISKSGHGIASTTRSLTAEGEIRGLAAIATRLGSNYRGKPIMVHISDRIDGPLDSDLVLLGGPAANRQSMDFLARVAIAREQELVIDAAKCSVITKAKTIELFDLQTERGIPRRDIAVIVVSPSPYNIDRRAVMCAGLTTYGTGAAAMLVFSNAEGASHSDIKELRKSLRSASALLLVECQLDRGRTVHWHILYSVTSSRV
jgi:hypothetical protein